MIDWDAITTLGAYGRAVADWLEGDLNGYPVHVDLSGPNDETAEITPVLARLNRSGWVGSHMSQPARSEPSNGTDWGLWQRAHVALLVDPRAAGLLRDVAETAGLLVMDAHGPHRLCITRVDRNDGAGIVDLTWANPDSDPLDGIAYEHQYHAPRLARRIGRGGLGVPMDVADVVWGRPDVLWDAMDDFINAARELGDPAAAPARAPGRNDPCPCGSGIKHKRCCGA